MSRPVPYGSVWKRPGVQERYLYMHLKTSQLYVRHRIGRGMFIKVVSANGDRRSRKDIRIKSVNRQPHLPTEALAKVG